MSSVNDYYDVAIKLTQEAGQIIRDAIYKEKRIETKISFVDLVTETDKKVEKHLFDGFRSHFPDHGFIGEEGTTKCELTDKPTWIVDPVDGTMNFVHGFPHVAVSIGLAVDKKMVLGIIYNPVLDQMYTGVKDKGSFFNGKKLQVSGVQDLPKALIVTELGSNRDPIVMDQVFTNYQAMAMKAHGIRSLGSAALNMCAVASGHAEAFFEYTLHCWDMAAGKVIIEEAGGTVIDPEGGPFDLMSRRVLCASSPQLAQTLSKELKHIQVKRD